MSDDIPRVCWEVEIEGMSCFVFATTFAKAKWIAVRSYREAGYGSDGRWPYVTAVRRERHDKSPARLQPARAYGEDYL